jgi:hypothetical protein
MNIKSVYDRTHLKADCSICVNLQYAVWYTAWFFVFVFGTFAKHNLPPNIVSVWYALSILILDVLLDAILFLDVFPVCCVLDIEYHVLTKD